MEDKFDCCRCSQVLAGDEIQVHLREHVGYTPFACGLCASLFHIRRDAQYHFSSPFSPHPGALPKVVERPKMGLEQQLVQMETAVRATKRTGPVDESRLSLHTPTSESRPDLSTAQSLHVPEDAFSDHETSLPDIPELDIASKPPPQNVTSSRVDTPSLYEFDDTEYTVDYDSEDNGTIDSSVSLPVVEIPGKDSTVSSSKVGTYKRPRLKPPQLLFYSDMMKKIRPDPSVPRKERRKWKFAVVIETGDSVDATFAVSDSLSEWRGAYYNAYILFSERRRLQQRTAALAASELHHIPMPVYGHEGLGAEWRALPESEKDKFRWEVGLRKAAALQRRPLPKDKAPSTISIDCHLCPSQFTQKPLFTKHLLDKHHIEKQDNQIIFRSRLGAKTEKVNCNVCNKLVSNYDPSRMEHVYRCHTELEPTYRCKRCPYDTFYWCTNFTLQISHLRSKHQLDVGRNWRPEFDDLRTAERRAELKAAVLRSFHTSMRKQHGPKECLKCGDVVGYGGLKPHVVKAHLKEVTILCKLCGLATTWWYPARARLHWAKAHSDVAGWDTVFEDRRPKLATRMAQLFGECFTSSYPNNLSMNPSVPTLDPLQP